MYVASSRPGATRPGRSRFPRLPPNPHAAASRPARRIRAAADRSLARPTGIDIGHPPRLAVRRTASPARARRCAPSPVAHPRLRSEPHSSPTLARRPSDDFPVGPGDAPGTLPSSETLERVLARLYLRRLAPRPSSLRAPAARPSPEKPSNCARSRFRMPRAVSTSCIWATVTPLGLLLQQPIAQPVEHLLQSSASEAPASPGPSRWPRNRCPIRCSAVAAMVPPSRIMLRYQRVPQAHPDGLSGCMVSATGSCTELRNCVQICGPIPAIIAWSPRLT